MKKEKERLVVIGSGMAGTASVEEVLKLDPKRYSITVFGAEKGGGYNRVLLTSVLTGDKTASDIATHGPEWYEENGVTLRGGSVVTRIERARKTIVAADGSEERYDKLILATGSTPVVPDMPGNDKPGVFTFRNLDDCRRIAQAAGGAKRAVVIGGGILGLEAAWGLKKLGLEVSVVHLEARLMERNLDQVSSGLLREDMETLGIEVLLNRKTVEITGGAAADGVVFSDGERVPAEVIVFSIGIRPNASLARSSGIYCSKGIVVSDTMQTYDPAVFAVGECVEHRGATFGLVGPVFEQARVAADHLAGKGRLSFKSAPTSARLKVPSIEVFSAGETLDSPDSIEYIDKGARVYKRVFLKNGRVSGAVLYGDTSAGPALFSSILSGEDVTHRRRTLLYGDGAPLRAAGDGEAVERMSPGAIVCGCNGITKGMIVEAVEKNGLFTVEDVKKHTRAGTSCGGCTSVIARIMEATLGASFDASARHAGICPCTLYNRDDILKNIRERELKSVAEVMETLGWETVGCETCRPAINYYVGMVWKKEAMDDPTSRLVNERMHANIQKDGTFSVVPRMYGGVTTPEELRRIAGAAIKHRVPLVKLTGGQRIALLGIKKEDLPSVWAEVGLPSGYAYAKALRTVKTCVGESFCRFGTQDSMALGIRLEKRMERLWCPAKVKMSVSGCPRNCSEAGIKDLGIVGVSGGWEIYAGGCGGVELKAAKKLASVKTGDEVEEIAAAFLQLYREEASYGERVYKWLDRAGLDAVKKAVVEDAENRKTLFKRLLASLEGTDPWKARHGLVA